MRNLLINKSWYFIIFCLWQGMCYATAVPQVINFDKSTYQAHSQNWSICQGANGFIYAGNSSGLLEFDGQHWALYTLPEKQKVRAVASINNGQIFTGAYGEFGYWEEAETGELRYKSLSESAGIESTKTEEIWHILIKDSLVFFQSFGTIYKYNIHSGLVTEIRPPSNILFAQLVGDDIIVPGINGTIYQWSPTTGYRLLEGFDSLADKRISFLMPFNEGMLIGTKLQGLFWYKNGQCLPFDHPLNEALKRYEINFGKLMSDGRMAIGTILNGIYFLDKNGQQLYHINKGRGLQNNTVLHLFEDHEHNLWAGLDSGIDLLILNKSFVYFRDNTGELGTVYAATLFEGHLYIGTNHGVFFQQAKATNDAFQLIEGSQGQTWELKVIDDQLICGHNLGTFIIQDKQFMPISDVTGGWSTLALSDRYLLQGTYTGLVLLGKKKGDKWQFLWRITGLNEPIEKIIQEDAHTFWLLHPYRGLKRVQLDSAFTQIVASQNFTSKEGLPTEFNLDLYKINHDIIIKSGDKYLTWTGQQLQDCAGIYQVPINQADELLEGQGDHWFKTENGQLEWWYKNQLQQKIRTNLVPGGTRILSIDQTRYLLCLEDSYIILEQNDSFHTESYMAPQIKRIEKSNYPINVSIPRTAQQVMIKPNWNNLKFTFANPVFTQKVLFRYRLEPVYPKWSNWSDATVKEFTNLPKGTYTFELQSNVTELSTTFTFMILPKWYETSLATLGFVVLLIGLLVTLWQWHERRMRRQERRLEIEKDRQLHQHRIQARNERLQIALDNKRREIANSTFNLVQKNEILLQIKERLSEMKKEKGAAFSSQQYHSIIQLINEQLHSRQDWELFERNFNEVHEDFFRRLKIQHPSLTPGDLKVAAYLRMNLSSKEIAPLLFITIRGVENKRYRLRKKIGLPNEDNLTAYLITF
ncbi:MAG: triple tyrosine motif-containing protein [Saprospiraceae bacterium]